MGWRGGGKGEGVRKWMKQRKSEGLRSVMWGQVNFVHWSHLLSEK